MIIIGPNLSLFIEYRFKEYFLSNTGYGVFSHRKHSTFCFLTKKTFTKTFFAFLLLLNFYFCPSEIFFSSHLWDMEEKKRILIGKIIKMIILRHMYKQCLYRFKYN